MIINNTSQNGIQKYYILEMLTIVGWNQEKMHTLTPQRKSLRNHVVAATTTTRFLNLTRAVASTLAILLPVGRRRVDDSLCLSSRIRGRIVMYRVLYD